MRIKKNIAVSESGFVFDPTTGDSFSLNRIGLEIIELLRQENASDEIIGELLKKYDVDKGSLEKYFYDFTSMLRYYQLIETSSASPDQAKDTENQSYK